LKKTPKSGQSPNEAVAATDAALTYFVLHHGDVGGRPAERSRSELEEKPGELCKGGGG